MAASDHGASPYARALLRGLIRNSGPSMSPDLLVARWMALSFSAQVLLEQLGPLLLNGELVLLHDCEDTRICLCDPSPALRRGRRGETLSYGEGVDFAVAVARVHEAIAVASGGPGLSAER